RRRVQGGAVQHLPSQRSGGRDGGDQGVAVAPGTLSCGGLAASGQRGVGGPGYLSLERGGGLLTQARKNKWTRRSENLADGLRCTVALDSAPVSYEDVLRHWRDDADFRAFFLALLADAPFSAYRWETPPVTAATAGRPFEFVLLDSP